MVLNLSVWSKYLSIHKLLIIAYLLQHDREVTLMGKIPILIYYKYFF